MKFSTGEAAVTRSVTKTPRDKEARVGWMRRRRRGERDEWCQGRRIGRDETGFALLITRRSQVQILPPLPTSSQVRGPFPLGEGLLHVWPVTRSVTRLLTSDVSVVPLRLRRNAVLRFVGHTATGRDT
jgi:hypothetical protein